MKECIHRTGPVKFRVTRAGESKSEDFFRCALAEAQTGVRHGFPASVCEECSQDTHFATDTAGAVKNMINRVLYNKVLRDGVRA